MKFYCIVDDLDTIHNPEAFDFLRSACEARGISFVPLVADTFDYSVDTTTYLEENSILYRLSISKRSRLLEGLVARADTATLLVPTSRAANSSDWGSVIAFMHAGLPIIPTIFGVSTLQKDVLPAYAEKLGGFPIVLKSSGGSHGNSVIRADSIESLRSIIGFVSNEKSAQFVLRKYIHNAQHIRCVVVGKTVVDAIKYLPQPGDFRTNTSATPQVESYARTPETEQVFALAEKAVALRGYALGGVDILIDEDGTAMIAEVNAPCNFGRNQMNTGVDIAGKIVDYLLARREQIMTLA